MDRKSENVPHVVIVGGGFGGLNAIKALKKAPVKVTLIDRSNHHLFQPLLYQVATAGLSPAEIAQPIRSVVRRQANASVLLAEVTSVNLEKRVLRLAPSEIPYSDVPYDYLILAAGARNQYYGHDEWSEHAVGLKTIDDALEIRRRVLLAFEAAEREHDSDRRRRLLNFVVIGGGATGVELAGALSELARFVLARDFREINPSSARIVLIEGGDRLLPAFTPDLSKKALGQLERMGVQVLLGSQVTAITADGVRCGQEFVSAATVLWGAGVAPSSLGKTLGVALDRAGRVVVSADCSIPEYPEAFVIGDMAAFTEDGKPLPGVAPVAIQQAKFVAQTIKQSLANEPRATFKYKDQGILATIGRKAAVAQFGKVELAGFLAWMAWLFIHIMLLIGFRNRVVVLVDWLSAYFAYSRGARLITGNRMRPGSPRLIEAPAPEATATPPAAE